MEKMSYTCQICKQSNLPDSQIIEVFGQRGEHLFMCCSCSTGFTFRRKDLELVTSKRRNINALIANPTIPIW